MSESTASSLLPSAIRRQRHRRLDRSSGCRRVSHVSQAVPKHLLLVTFIASYFAIFWIAWRLAVRVTEPRSRLADTAKTSLGLRKPKRSKYYLWSGCSRDDPRSM